MSFPVQKDFKKITVVSSISGTAGRDYLSGVFRFAEDMREWRLEVLDNPDALDQRIRQTVKPDGIIVLLPHENLTMASICRWNIPTIIADFPPKDFATHESRISFVRLDDSAIGTAAAEHLLERGNFNSFLCLIDQPQFRYGEIREQAFRAALEKRNRFIKTIRLAELNSSERDYGALRLTLSRLPHPVGVFVTRDRAALYVYDACRLLGFSIPEEVAVIGVDNDELFCNTVSVPLSSIWPDHEKVGFLAARELRRLMNGGRGTEVVLRQSVKQVVLRASSRTVPPSAHIVAEILSYIESHVSGTLRVSDVTNHLRINRRLADMRFRQVRNETILDAIANARMARAKKRLIASHDPIAQIAGECGFSSPAVFSRFFKVHAGDTPNAWRAKRQFVP